jgi:polyisoprenoid-binding protein YceI
MSAVNRSGATSIIPAGEWSVDPSRSSVAFAIKHMMVATVNGRFRDFDGTLAIGPGAPRASGVVRAVSIDTNDPVRDEHLRRSSDFFDVERFPEMTFEVTRIEYLYDRRGQIVGDLTMRGITREIELDANARASSRGGGDERIELELRGEVNRTDFGLVWNQALETGGALLSNRVRITLELSVVRSPPAGADGAGQPRPS